VADGTGQLWLSAQAPREIDALWRRYVLRMGADGAAKAAYSLDDLGAAIAFAPDGALWATGSALTKVTP
jgi:hypothetical protein